MLLDSAMLIEFRVQNYRSLFAEQALTFQAGNVGDSGDRRVRKFPRDRRQLCAAAIFGANASGKTNVLSALAWMRSAVVLSHVKNEPGRGVPRSPFAFGSARAQSSVFEVELLLDGVRYQYGFAVTDEAFTEEWLYAWPKGHKQTWLERDGQSFRFGKSAPEKLRSIREFTRPNALFLSASVQLAQEDWLPIHRWFARIELVGMDPAPRSFRHQMHWDARLIRFMEKHAGDPEQHVLFDELDPPRPMEQLLRMIRSADVGVEAVKLRGDAGGQARELAGSRILLRHQSSSADSWLSLADESKGTQTMLRLGLPVIEALEHGSLVVVDELETSLHSLLAIEIVRLFQDPETNPRGAQLLFTTHDTALLGTAAGAQPVLRRDQIWITEKDREGATSLYPLTDYKPRSGENLERGYMQGRYGGIPHLGRLVEPEEETCR